MFFSRGRQEFSLVRMCLGDCEAIPKVVTPFLLSVITV